jgi:hypothetical protein
MERQRWLGDARKRVYATQKEWVAKLHELGWEIPQSTIANWESVGFLPYSLSTDTFNLICRSLEMSVNEVGRLQGLDISEKYKDVSIPAPVVGVVQELVETDLETLKKIAPMIEMYVRLVKQSAKG